MHLKTIKIYIHNQKTCIIYLYEFCIMYYIQVLVPTNKYLKITEKKILL